jgi:hypothetical protein
MPEFGSGLSDLSSEDDDGSNWGDDESNADTNSEVSDYDEVAANEIIDPM